MSHQASDPREVEIIDAAMACLRLPCLQRPHRLVLIWRHLVGLGVDETAKRMLIDVEQVRRIESAAIQSIRRELPDLAELLK